MPVRPLVPLALLLLLVPAAARAAEVPDVEAEEELRDFALTVAPVNLLALGTLKLNGELRLADEWGLQASLGAGSLDLDNGRELAIREGGGQLRWYPVGDFDHGMQLGLEVMFLRLAYPSIALDEEGLPVDVDLSADITAIGPFVGYKVAFDGGFTLELQAGVQHYGVETSAEADLSRVHEDLDGVSALLVLESSFWAPLANLNLGWSF